MKLNVETIFTRQGGEEFRTEIVAGRGIGKAVFLLTLFAVVGAMVYGFTMGIRHSPEQACAASVKLYLLFAATLAVCLPTLHFIGLLFGSRISFAQTVAVLLAGVARSCVLLGAFAPISMFFTISGARYEFLMLMHVFILACCGAVGLASVKRDMDAIRAAVTPEGEELRSRWLLRIWFFLYMFIGAQMSFLLSPFVGRDAQFIFITSEKGDFFSYLLRMIRDWMLQ